MTTEDYFVQLREKRPFSRRDSLLFILRLSLPAFLSQLSMILMQYIDTAMVGQTGAEASASIGLVATSTWLLGSVAFSSTIGFTVQVSQLLGAKQNKEARCVLNFSIPCTLLFSILLLLLGSAVSGHLPLWLGGDASILSSASHYFLIYSLFIPVLVMNELFAGMLRSSGNVKVPSVLLVIMCFLDVVFNFFLIFPGHNIGGLAIPGAGLGVVGAALGTGLAQLVSALLMAYFLFVRTPALKHRAINSTGKRELYLKTALKISLPISGENIVMCAAQIAATRIIAPLGITAIAANSFAVTAESLCYMPGYGIADAATVVTGQSSGAGNTEMTRKFARLSAKTGIVTMTLIGILMFIAAPLLIGFLTPVEEIKELAVSILRIEAFAEPLYGASIVIAGALRGTGYTMVSFLINFASMWGVRIPLAWLLTQHLGLYGVWIAMATELCIRGLLFIITLLKENYLKQTKERN